MSPELLDSESEIEQLRKRVAQLERRTSSRRGRTNGAGAAAYLGIAPETLRIRMQTGTGPHGTKSGRFWSFTYDELDRYAEEGADA